MPSGRCLRLLNEVDSLFSLSAQGLFLCVVLIFPHLSGSQGTDGRGGYNFWSD